jgi:hypothetical protein
MVIEDLEILRAHLFSPCELLEPLEKVNNVVSTLLAACYIADGTNSSII